MMLTRLAALLSELEILITEHESRNTSVSQSTIGWQIEHSLLAIDGIIEAVQKSKPTDYKWRFNMPRLIIFTFEKLRRGAVQAPETVSPKGNFNAETLQLHINATKKKIKVLSTLHAKQHFSHRFFGMLNLKSSIHFLEIHTNHHLEIIFDIVRLNHKVIKT
jgi:hypothetical protein